MGLYEQRLPPQPARIPAHGGGLRLCSRASAHEEGQPALTATGVQAYSLWGIWEIGVGEACPLGQGIVKETGFLG